MVRSSGFGNTGAIKDSPSKNADLIKIKVRSTRSKSPMSQLVGTRGEQCSSWVRLGRSPLGGHWSASVLSADGPSALPGRQLGAKKRYLKTMSQCGVSVLWLKAFHEAISLPELNNVATALLASR